MLCHERENMEKTKTTEKRFLNLLGVAFLSFLLPGLAHLSSGRVKKAVIIYVVFQISIFASFFVFLRIALPYNLILSVTLFTFVYLYAIIDSVLLAKNPANTLKLKPILGYSLLVAVIMFHSTIIRPLLGNLIKQKYIQAFKIPSDSMFPTLLLGDMLLVDKHAYSNNIPKRGDVIVFQSPENPSKTLIRRIVGLGGETIEIKNTKVYINGSLYAEPYEINTDKTFQSNERNTLNPFVIPGNSYFVIGDNRDQKHDNTFWGIVDRKDVNGKAVKFYWSWNKDNSRVRWDRIGRDIK
jgi:signal peptidase I